MIIAVDAVGGDHFPENPVAGAVLAAEENPEIQILLVGPDDVVTAELSKHSYDKSRVHTLHAPQIIGMNESPSSAVKTKQSSSIAFGLTAHNQGKCAAFVSAGNTGALLAASTFILGKLEGVIRPTIVAPYPTIKGISLLIDAGANLEPKPEMILQFAKMGEIYCREIMGIEQPTVGQLNVGEEAEKGTDLQKNSHLLLTQLNGYRGNIEGKDILFGKTDIYITDGFTGNVVLKFGESIPDALKHMLSLTMKSEDIQEEMQMKIYSILEKSLKTFNYEHVGGVPFLGVNGTSLVGHGGSSPNAIKNMIFSAAQCVEHKVNSKIISSLKN